MSTNEKSIVAIEELEQRTVIMLQQAAGMGAMIIKWNIDYTVGCGIIDDTSKCIWTEDGLRIECSMSRDGAIFISQAKNRDPLYDTLERKYVEKKTRKN